MELKDAIGLIEKGIPKIGEQLWLDLGAGSGLFTHALASILPEGSTVYAIDKENSLQQFSHSPQLQVKTVRQDFVSDPVVITNCDGILMANSLHYAKDQAVLLSKLKALLKPGARIIVVEYDTLQQNSWVPYPVSFAALAKMVNHITKVPVVKLATLPSVYHSGGIYAALIRC
ncbi:MAG: class I SAM-dependent methyltransferase [Chitinophagaceae bacterium]